MRVESRSRSIIIIKMETENQGGELDNQTLCEKWLLKVCVCIITNHKGVQTVYRQA